MTEPLEARPVPDIVTPPPGPKARAHVEFDHACTSPSLPRAYPIVPVRGRGCAIEDIDGNLFLDFAAGIAVNSTGHSHPDVVAAIQRQADDLLHFSARDFYLPIYAQAAAELARIAPMRGPNRAFIGNSRRRGGRGRDQARASPHGAPVPRRVPGRLPRPHLRRRDADRLEGQVPRGLRPAAAGRLPRAVRQRGPATSSRARLQAPDAGQRGRGDHRRADPGRGRLRRPRGRLPAAPARDLRRPRHPADRRRGPVRRRADRARCGRSSTGASSPTSCCTAKGIALGHADRRPWSPAPT